MTLGASAIMSRFQEAWDLYGHRYEKGYANIIVDAEAVRDAIALLSEMAKARGQS